MGNCSSINKVRYSKKKNKDLPNVMMPFDKKEKIKYDEIEPRNNINIFPKEKENTIRENSNNEKKELIELELFFSIYDISDISGKYKIKFSLIENNKINQSDETEEQNGGKIEFKKSLIFNYFFEKKQIIKIEIYENNKRITKMNIAIANILQRINFIYSEKIEIEEKKFGILELTLEETEKYKFQKLISEFSFEFELYNNNNIEEYNVQFVKKTNKIDVKKVDLKNEKFKIEKYQIPTSSICDSKKDKINIVLNNTNQNNQIEYYCTFTIEETEKKKKFILKKKSFFINEEIGKITIIHNETEKITFLDLLKKKLKIKLNIAIDYTDSNLDPQDENSYHYFKNEYQNNYEKSLLSIGNILKNYNFEEVFDVFGHGAILNYEDKVNHCFNINLQESPNIQFLDSVIRAYKQSLNLITLFHPCRLSQILKKNLDLINNSLFEKKYENNYFVLLFLNKGYVINDYSETKELLYECSFKPLSIIFLNIEKEKSNKKDIENDLFDLNERDFVQLIDFKDDLSFTEEALRKIPNQILEYFNTN